MGGIPKPDRDALDSARWMAYDAANEYLAERRSKRAPRRPQDPPAPSGKLLHHLEGFRHFRFVVFRDLVQLQLMCRDGPIVLDGGGGGEHSG